MTHGELTRFTMCTLLIGGSVASAADLFSTVNRTAGASQRVRELLARGAGAAGGRRPASGCGARWNSAR